MAEDDITLQIKLEWTQRRLEESEQLASQLRHSLDSLLTVLQESQEKASVLSLRQDELVAERNALEARIEDLIKEKSELAAENATLRSVAKEANQKAVLLTSADALVSNLAKSAAGQRSMQPPSEAEGSDALDRLSASRHVVARLLWIIHRAGLRLRDSDLLGSGQEEGRDSAHAGTGAGTGAGADGGAQMHAQRMELARAVVEACHLHEYVETATAEAVARGHAPSSASLSSSPGNHSSKFGAAGEAGEAGEGEGDGRHTAAEAAVATLRGHAAGAHGVAHSNQSHEHYGPLPAAPGMGHVQGAVHTSSGAAGGVERERDGKAGDGGTQKLGLLGSFFSILVGDVQNANDVAASKAAASSAQSAGQPSATATGAASPATNQGHSHSHGHGHSHSHGHAHAGEEEEHEEGHEIDLSGGAGQG